MSKKLDMKREVHQDYLHKVVLMEYERGWGSRVDDILYFRSKEDAEAYTKDFNSENTASSAPDWYMVATYKGVVS